MTRLDLRGPSGLRETFYQQRDTEVTPYWVAWVTRQDRRFHVRIGRKDSPYKPALTVVTFEVRALRDRMSGRRLSRLCRKRGVFTIGNDDE